MKSVIPLIIFKLTFAIPSFACTCAGYNSLSTYFNENDIVISGSNYVNDTIGDKVYANFVIDQIWKGFHLQDTFRFHSGYTYDASSLCLENFDQNKYILFARMSIHSDTIYHINLCDKYLYQEELAFQLDRILSPLSNTINPGGNNFDLSNYEIDEIQIYTMAGKSILIQSGHPLPPNTPLLIIIKSTKGILRKKLMITEQ